jgi:UTP:GlnB (protein PII) uridylyltransferase
MRRYVGSMGSANNGAVALVTRVWFADGRDGASELFVETPDRLGILFAVVTAIIGARVKILKSEATISNGLARDWFLVAEADGRPIAAARREHLRLQVLSAIDTWWQRGAA